MRFIQSVISLKRSRVRAYSTVRAAHHCADAASVYRKALSASIQKITSTLLSLKVHMVRAEIAPAARICLEADGNYVLAVRGALSDILFWALPVLYSLLGLGLRYCAGYIHGIFRSIR